MARARDRRSSSAARPGSSSVTSTWGFTSSARRRCGRASRSRASPNGWPLHWGSRRTSCPRPMTGCAPGSRHRPASFRSRSGSSRAGTATRSTPSASRATPHPRPESSTRIERRESAAHRAEQPVRLDRADPRGRAAIREALAARSVPAVAVSPLIGGRAVKGPADRMLARLAGGTSPAHVAAQYAGLIDAIVVDEADADDLDGLAEVRPIVTRTLMTDPDARKRLAEAALGAVVA